MTFRHTLRAAAVTALLATSFGSAHSASISFSSTATPTTLTDWSSFADLQQFDPSQGVLQQVTLELFADLSGIARAENRDRTAAAMTLKLQATLALARPDGGAVLVQTTPLASSVFQATKKDNGLTIDYAGTAGVTLDNLSASASSQASFNDSATLALFTGSGLLRLPFSAVAQSYGDGSGNLRTDFTTLAGGYAKVTYEFSPSAVPEPTTWALMLSGIVLLGWMASRRAA